MKLLRSANYNKEKTQIVSSNNYYGDPLGLPPNRIYQQS